MAASLTMADDSVTTDDGTITNVWADVDSVDVSWDGLDTAATSLSVELMVQDKDGDWFVCTSKSVSISGKHGSKSFGDADITKESILSKGTGTVWTKSDFEEGTDGETNKTDVTAKLHATIYSGTEELIDCYSSEDTFTISVTNQAKSSSVGGTGEGIVS